MVAMTPLAIQKWWMSSKWCLWKSKLIHHHLMVKVTTGTFCFSILIQVISNIVFYTGCWDDYNNCLCFHGNMAGRWAGSRDSSKTNILVVGYWKQKKYILKHAGLEIRHHRILPKYEHLQWLNIYLSPLIEDEKER